MDHQKRMLLPRRAQIQRAQTQSIQSAFPQNQGFYSRFKSVFSSIWQTIFPPAPNVIVSRSPRQPEILPLSFYTQLFPQSGPLRVQTATGAPTPGRFDKLPSLKRPRQKPDQIEHQLKKLKVNQQNPKHIPKMTMQAFKPSMKPNKLCTPFWHKHRFKPQNWKVQEVKVEKEQRRSSRTENTLGLIKGNMFEGIKGFESPNKEIKKPGQSAQVTPEVLEVPKPVKSQEKHQEDSVVKMEKENQIQKQAQEQHRVEPKTQVLAVGFKPSENVQPGTPLFKLPQQEFNPFIKKPVQNSVQQKLKEPKLSQPKQRAQNKEDTHSNTKEIPGQKSLQKILIQTSPSFQQPQNLSQIPNPSVSQTSQFQSNKPAIQSLPFSKPQNQTTNLQQAKFETSNNPFLNPSTSASNQFPDSKPKFVFGASNNETSPNPFTGQVSHIQANPFISTFQPTTEVSSGFQPSQIRDSNPFVTSYPSNFNPTTQPSFPNQMNGSANFHTNSVFASTNVFDKPSSFGTSAGNMQGEPFQSNFQPANTGFFPADNFQNQPSSFQPAFQSSFQASSGSAVMNPFGAGQVQSSFSLGVMLDKKFVRAKRPPQRK